MAPPLWYMRIKWTDSYVLMETNRKRGGESRPAATAADEAGWVFHVQSGCWEEGRCVRGVEPVSPSWLGISPRASLFRCMPRLSLTRRRSQICHIRAVAQTLPLLCDCLSCVTLITLLTVTWLKEEVALSNPEVRLTSASVIVHVSYPANQVKVASWWYALHLSSLLLYFYGLSAGTFWYGINLLTHNASATLY